MSRHMYYDQEAERQCQVVAIIECDLMPVKIKVVADYEEFNLIEWTDSHGRVYFREWLCQKRRPLQ